jgi:hypothetical protein
MRRGFQLAEVLVAVALAAGPIATAVHLVHTGHREIRSDTDQAQARILLDDLIHVLEDAPLSDLRDLAKGPIERLQAIGASRLERLSPELVALYRPQLEPLLEKLAMELAEDAGGIRSLAVLRVSTRTPAGVPVRICRVLRVH